LLRKLRAMRRSLPARDQLLMRIGAAKTEAGRAFGFVQIQLPGPRQPVTRESFHFSVSKRKLKDAELRDGHYLCAPMSAAKTRPCCGRVMCN